MPCCITRGKLRGEDQLTEFLETRLAPFRARASWALFQTGRDTASTLLLVFIFAPYFTTHVVGDPVRGQELWGFTMSLAGVCVALSAPFFGAIADIAGRRKPWIGTIGFLMSGCAIALWWALPGGAGLSIALILLLLVIYQIGVPLSDAFHNSMLPSLAPASMVGRLSGLGFFLSQLGIIFLLLVMLYAFMLPGETGWPFIPDAPLFGIDPVQFENSRIAGPICGLWLIACTILFLRFTPDTPRNLDVTLRQAVHQSVGRVWSTLRDVRHHKNVAIYLFSRMLFTDGMAACFVFSGIYAAGIFQWDALTLTLYGIIISSMTCTSVFLSGFFDQKVGSKRALSCGLLLMSTAFVGMLSFYEDRIFFFIELPVVARDTPFALLSEKLYLINMLFFALGAGPILVSARALLARISPPEKITEFFGLFALSGTVTAFVGPLMVGIATSMFQSQRIGFGSLLLLLGAGFIGLQFVREERAPARL